MADDGTSVRQLLAAGLSDAITAMVHRILDIESADCGIGTVTAVNPGGTTGTVSIDVASGTALKVRHSATYSPVVGDKVKWSRSRAGDRFVDYKLA